MFNRLLLTILCSGLVISPLIINNDYSYSSSEAISLKSIDDVNNVNALIDDIYEFDYVTYPIHIDEVTLAKEAYDNLSNDDKALISSDRKDKLDNACNMIIAYQNTKIANDLIATLPASSKVNYTNYKSYKDILEEITYYYELSSKSDIASKSRYTSVLNKYNTFASIDQLIVDINNIGEITYDNYQDKQILIKSYFATYKGLSTANRKLVTNYSTLVDKDDECQHYEDVDTFIAETIRMKDGSEFDRWDHRDEHFIISVLEDIQETFTDEDRLIVGQELLDKYNLILSVDNGYCIMDDVTDALDMLSYEKGQCVSKYPLAKETYLLLSSKERISFKEEYISEYYRLQAWANYHGEKIDDNLDIVTYSKPMSYFISDDGTDNVLLIVIATGSVTLLMGIFVFVIIYNKKRKLKNR